MAHDDQRAKASEGPASEEIVKAKIRRALLSGPDCITKDATVAEMDAQRNMTVLRPGTNKWVCILSTPSVFEDKAAPRPPTLRLPARGASSSCPGEIHVPASRFQLRNLAHTMSGSVPPTTMTRLRLRPWAVSVLVAATTGCLGPAATPTASEQQALGATTDFIFSCPQPTDPEFNGNAGDWCLAQYGGDTSFCSGLCCPQGSTMTYEGDGGGFKAGPAYCVYPDTCAGYSDAHPEYTNGCVDYVDGQSPQCPGTVVGVGTASGELRCCCTYSPDAGGN